MNKTLNVRYLVRLLVIFAVVAGTVHLIHRRQARKQAEAFLHQADSAERSGDYSRTAQYLRGFLVFRPDNTDARARLGLLMAQTARTAAQKFQAFLELEQVLREDGDRADVRQRDIALAMDPQLRRYAEAMAHIDKHLAANPDDGTFYDLKGQCLTATGDPLAESAFRDAVKQKPELIPAYGRLAALLRQRLDQPKEADAVIKAMLKENGGSAAAHLTAANYYLQLGSIEEFKKEVEEARKYGPDDPEVILARTQVTQMRADEHARLARKETDILIKNKEIEKSRAALDEACGLLRHGIEKCRPKLTTVPPLLWADREDWLRQRRLAANLYVTLVSFEVRLNRLPEAEKAAEQGIEGLPEYSELRAQLADVCILQKQWERADKQIDDLKKMEYPEANIGLLRGQILSGKGEWLSAARTLEAAAATAAASPALLRQIQFLLAICYDQIGLFDRRYEACVKALPPDPRDDLWFQVSMRTAAALAESGRTREAIEIYERVALQYTNAFIPLARLRLQETLRQPADKREWGPIEKLLDPKVAPEEVDREILRADVLFAQKKTDDAQDALVTAREKFPDAIEPWAALAYFQFLQSREKPELAAETLAQAERKFGDRVLFRLIRAKMIPLGKPADVAKELERLAGDLDKFTPDERRRLLQRLAEVAQASATPDLAGRLWDRLAGEASDNLGIHLARFDNAMHANDKARLIDAKEQIARIDPAGSSNRAAQVLYWIWEAEQTGNLENLPQASELLRELARQRTAWSKIPLAEGRIFELQKKRALAREKYQEAFDLGERSPNVIRRLVELYTEGQMYREAAAVLKKLPEGAERTDGFLEVVTVVSLQTRNFDMALKAAAKAVPEDTTDYHKQLWLARVFWLAREPEKVMGPLSRALKLAPEKPDAWVLLVQYHVNTGGKDDAEKTIERAKGSINKADAPLAIAQCYESVGRTELAREMYEQTLKDRPNDLRVLKNFANFRLQEGNRDGALELLERVLKSSTAPPEDQRDAQRLLTLIRVTSPDYGASRQALERFNLLEKGLVKPLSGTETTDEIRTTAEALALQRDLRSKREAIKLLVALGQRQPLRDTDQFLLAQLHNLVGDWPQAKVVLTTLVRTEKDNPTYIAYFASNLLRHTEVEAAGKSVSELEKIRPDDIQTIGLRARVLAASGDLSKARDLLLKQADKPNAQVAGIARLLEELGAGPAAEPLYQQLVANSKKPEAVLALASYYGRQGRTAEALAVCDQAWKTAQPESVGSTCVGVLYSARALRPEDMKHVAARLEEALGKNPGSLTLLSSMAALLNLSQDYAGAIAHYRKVIARNSKDILAHNNLAYLLSAKESRHDEALKELDIAKKAFGPLPTLLDTEAQVFLAKKDPSNAIRLLDDVIAQGPTAANYFHLAQAHFALKNTVDARVAWNKAKKLNLKPADLHPLERAEYDRLDAELSKP